MSYRRCQNWLAGIWVIFFVAQAGLLLMRSIVGATDIEEGRKLTSEMWSWYIPMVMLTLSVNVAALFGAPSAQTADAPLARVVIIVVLSLAYLMSVSALIVLPPSMGARHPRTTLRCFTRQTTGSAPSSFASAHLSEHFFQSAPRDDRSRSIRPSCMCTRRTTWR